MPGREFDNREELLLTMYPVVARASFRVSADDAVSMVDSAVRGGYSGIRGVFQLHFRQDKKGKAPDNGIFTLRW